MAVLLLGATGQVGGELLPYFMLNGSGDMLDAPGRSTLDLTDLDNLRSHIRSTNPTLIINASAYNDVDGAEQEEELAYRINAEVPLVLAQTAAEIKSKLIHYSTDYVFDGTKGKPYDETDAVNPLSVYAKSKAKGEQNIINYGPNAVIFRTSWVYSTRRNNFLLTICNLMDLYADMHVVNDQIGTPNSASFIAKVTIEYIKQNLIPANGPEIVHLTCNGWASRFEFACAIRDNLGDPKYNKIIQQTTQEYMSQQTQKIAVRPKAVILNNELLKSKGIQVPEWEDELSEYINKNAGPKKVTE